jgi:uncharacterized membrane protein YqaE (UPF0057 family)
MASDCLYLTFIWIFTLFLSPLTVGIFFGCGKTLAINIVLYILGVIPGNSTNKVRNRILNNFFEGAIHGYVSFCMHFKKMEDDY